MKFMTDIDQLIHLNVELEGVLKVLRDRNSAEARKLLADKIELYTSGVNALLSEYEAAEHREVKRQEAVEAEVEPEEEAAEAAVAAEMEHNAEPEPEYEPEPEHQHRAEPNERLLKAFTLNDRFRFRRELFGGDDADFSDTIKLLAEMDSYSEACDYLYNDMMWDKDDPNVADFMDIVAANMPQ